MYLVNEYCRIQIKANTTETRTRQLHPKTHPSQLRLGITYWFAVSYNFCMWPRQESNLDLELRKLLYYPLYYGANYLSYKVMGLVGKLKGYWLISWVVE